MAKLQKTSIAPFFMLARIRLASESEILHRTSFVCIAATYISQKKNGKKKLKTAIIIKTNLLYALQQQNSI